WLFLQSCVVVTLVCNECTTVYWTQEIDVSRTRGRPVSQQPVETGRVAQRRRTRRAIVEAAAELLRAGAEPSVNEIAAAAEVSRRTVYLYYPTLDQLVLDATISTLNVDVDAALAAHTS